MNIYDLRDQNTHVNVKEMFPCTVQARNTLIPYIGSFLLGKEKASMILDYSRGKKTIQELKLF